MIQKYFKDYDGWNHKKKNLNGLPEKQFSEREIWWVSLGVNVGTEIDGKNYHFERPILVLKKISNHALWALPIGSTPRKGNYFHTIQIGNRSKTISLHQIRLVSSKRLLRNIDRIDFFEYLIILKKMQNLLPIKRIPLWMRGISVAFRHDENSIAKMKKFTRLIFDKIYLLLKKFHRNKGNSP
ncbi:MAG: type II toxin-antitoxin system PemK/MazF family toxin [Candidatus Pacebacteria bacterium]|nr:type II toxin-antitoxin system PemK/MazF family toxin [Candidatus Paceibacterota bacterium]